jgi:tetratricopeptide (TPR) repeat protein
MTRARLDELASAIADGSPIDTPALPPSEEPAAIAVSDSARLVERVAEFYRRLPQTIDAAHAGSTDISDRLLLASDTPLMWGPLTIEQRISGGTFGDVYRAHDPRLNRRVALKLLRRRGRQATAVVEEGHRLARVRHPNVVTVHGAECIDGQVGLWMEYLDGETLEAELRARGPFPAAEVASIGRDLAGALEAVHRAGLVHRDVKAQNVMRDAAGRAVLTDFGAGRDTSRDGDAGDQELAGTPLYLAPEVLGGQPASIASDVYSLGILLYHLATGAFPVRGGSLEELRRAHTNRAATPLRSLRPELPRGLASIIERATDPDPARRIATPTDLRAALERVGRTRTIRLTVAAAVAGVAVAAGTGLWSAFSSPAMMLGFQPRDYVLVSRFDNRTGDAVFDGAIEYALERELAGSDRVSIVPRDRVGDALELMKRPGNLVVDRKLALEVALRDGMIKAVVTGRIERFGSRYVLAAEIVNPQDGSTVASQVEEAVGQEQVVDALRRHAQRIRRALGETVGRLQPGPLVEPATTASLKAFQLYNESHRLQSAGNSDSATALAREAVAEDPDFAAGWIWLAWLSKNAKNPAPSREAADRAKALSDQTSEWERLLIHAIDGYFSGDVEAAVASSRAVLQLRPNHYVAAEVLSLALARLNRRGEASEALQRLADLRPHHLDGNLRAAQSLVAATQDDAVARPYVDRVRTLIDADPARADSRAALWVALYDAYAEWRDRRIESVAERLDRILTQFAGSRQVSMPSVAYGLLNFHVSLGQLARAEEVVDMIPDPNLRDRHRMGIWVFRDDDEVRMRLLAEEPAMRARNQPIGPGLFLRAGLIDRARAAVAAADATATTDPTAPATVARVRGELALRDGRMQEAVEISSAAFTAMLGQTNMGEYHRACQTLAKSFSLTGRGSDAVRQLEMCAAHEPYLNDTFFFGTSEWMRTRLQLADEYRQAGRPNDAELIEDDLRRLLAVADVDYPLLRRLSAR